MTKLVFHKIVIYIILGEYQQNLCNNSDPTCVPCPSRLPSCKGKPDGLNPFPNQLWNPPYIECFKNRTIDIKKCSTGYFNPRMRKCMEPVEKGKFHF